MSRIGLALIAKNEEHTISTLLESISGVFDRVVLLDTGSTDDTIDVFNQWVYRESQGHNPYLSWTVGRYEWKDDFADARNAADALLVYGDPKDFSPDSKPMVDWKVWADCDDIIENAHNIRHLVDNAPDGIDGFFCTYNYAQHPETGACVCELRRERILRVRSGVGPAWTGRVHEAQTTTGPLQTVDPSVVQWVHRKQFTGGGEVSNERNLRILTKWLEDEPNNHRVLAYCGTETMVMGRHDEAIDYFNRYLSLKPEWPEEYAQVARKLAQIHMMREEWDDARQCGYLGLNLTPNWPDNYLTLAEHALFTGLHPQAIQWATRALEIGQPDTLLITNPLDYAFLPHKIRALSLRELGQPDAALEAAQAALSLHPGDPQVREVYENSRAIARREHTANTFAMCAEQLINHDEQEKALILLTQCVPHFATDHPRVAELRRNLRQRISWAYEPVAYEDHYETGGSKPEDFIPDDRIDALCEALPRTGFLLRGVQEQISG